MIRRRIRIEETIATVLAEEEYVAVAEAEIRRQRRLIKDYIAADRDFLTALEPYPTAADAPEIVRRMSDAGCRAGVGPMAAVAGAVAEYAVRAMAAAGAGYAVVDNGGDVAMLISRPVTIGIFTGPARIRDIGMRVMPRPNVFGVCTSSGTVGHSLSFGRADAALVVADDVCLADAAATTLGNAIQRADDDHIREAMQRHMIEGVDGLLVVVDDALGTCGNLPEIIGVRVDSDAVSA